LRLVALALVLSNVLSYEGLSSLSTALTATGVEVDVDWPILIIVGSVIGLLFSFRKDKTTQRGSAIE
jgi:hypothetical protein